ncbi:hypothetical protein AVEN_122861-1 [Araneus ventricosus]|uniref:Uncharacterized protein n=1 Tax=Araneus ventricosus TaxID=182803 RepID=A0A4Y2QR32_ARAVE|nr:hypothetical protein AVEN_122861-1 [Araneus ventricosus]
MVLERSLRASSQQTLGQHRRAVLCQIAKWLGLSDAVEKQDCVLERQHLLTMLLTIGKKKRMKELPRDETDWSRMLTQWLRFNTLSNGHDVKTRHIYRILGVDGFEGLEAKHLKNYLPNVLHFQEMRCEYQSHLKAVRKMYDWIDTNDNVSCLTGTDSACIVCLALLHLYGRMLDIVDDQTIYQVERMRLYLEGFLYRNSKYYRDVHKVTNELLKKMGTVYMEACGKGAWQVVAHEQLSIKSFFIHKEKTKTSDAKEETTISDAKEDD